VRIHNVLIKVSTLAIYDKDVQHDKAGQAQACPFSHDGSKLLRRGNILADISLYRYTDSWILHGCGKQPGYFGS
jgi:hypothetical protein